MRNGLASLDEPAIMAINLAMSSLQGGPALRRGPQFVSDVATEEDCHG